MQGHRSRGSPETMGSGARRPGRRGRRQARRWVHRNPGASGQGAEVPAGSLGWRRAAGGLCRVCREVRKSLSPLGPAALPALRAGAPAFCRGLFSAVSPSGSEQRLPASLREGRETGLGEVERLSLGSRLGREEGLSELMWPLSPPPQESPGSSQGWTQSPSAWGQPLTGRSSPPRIQRPRKMRKVLGQSLGLDS